MNVLKGILSPLQRTFGAGLRFIASVFIVLFLGWFFAKFVIAEKEAHVYIFPSTVNVDGFENGAQSLGQDLSGGAELPDFTRENSAFVFFGTAPTPPATSTPEEIPSTTPPEVSSEIPPPQPTPETTDDVPVVPPATESEMSPIVPELIPEILPTVDVQPEVSLPSAQAEVFSRIAKFFRAHRALALDVPMNLLPLEAVDSTEEVVPILLDATSSATGASNDKEEGALISTTSSSSPALTPLVNSEDAYSVSLCTTLGKPCHVLLYEGFGLGGALEGHTFLDGTLEVSLGGKGEYSSGEYDRVLLRAYHDGRWEFLGETTIRGDTTNGKRGGYFSLPMPQLAAWGDLSDLKIALEYDRASDADAALYVDGLWINVKYASDATDTTTPEDVALAGPNMRSSLFARDAEARRLRRDVLTTPAGVRVDFVNTETHPDATIQLKTDAANYRVLGSGTTYFNLTNDGDTAEEVRLQFHFTGEDAKVTSLARFVHNIPYNIGEPAISDVGYFCDAGWSPLTLPSYQCATDSVVRVCDSLNTDGTNCIAESLRVGLDLGVSYRDGWSTAVVREGSLRNEDGLFRNAINRILSDLPADAIVSSQLPTAYLGESVLVEPGQTLYFRADIEVPLNGRGDFSIEAVTSSGAYGLVSSSWDGSWNYQFPVTIDDHSVATEEMFAVPISLDAAAEEFWQHVRDDGADVRVVDSTETTELAYWMASFDKASRHALLWVRIPTKEFNATTSVHVYFGDVAAQSRSHPTLPFRTDELTVRGMVFGGSQRDMLLHVIALDDDTRVLVGTGVPQLLKRGESALFENVPTGATVHSNAPIVASVETLGGNASYVPIGYAGQDFVLPGVDIAGELRMGLPREVETHAALFVDGVSETLDPLYGSIVTRPISLSESIPVTTDGDVVAMIASERTESATPLYPISRSEVFGLVEGSTVVGSVHDSTAFTALCSSGARKSEDGRRRGMTSVLNHCVAGDARNADAVRVFDVSHALGAFDFRVADERILPLLPEYEFAEGYISPIPARAVVVVCPAASFETVLSVYDPEGGVMASSTCTSMGTRPAHAYLLPEKGVFPVGFRIERTSPTSTPFLAYAVSTKVLTENEGTLAAGVIPLGSPALSRTEGSGRPVSTLGEVAFVVPGEHRKLDIAEDGLPKEHVDVLLSKEREFSIHQSPLFRFQYRRQSNSFMQNVRDVFGVTPFAVSKVLLKHPLFGDVPMEYSVTYGEGNEWSLALTDTLQKVRPGKYTLHIEIVEGGETYVDEFDFYWGVLAINYTKSIYTPNEHVDVSIGALSNNGNTICDAQLKLWVTTPLGIESEIPVVASGKCNGNNVVDVPDYTAGYDIGSNATGTYRVKLVRFDGEQNIASQVSDSFEVRSSVPYEIERFGPTRIYPLAHYPMKIRVRANEAFEGNIVERIPGDFVVIDRGNANLEWGDAAHTFITATWGVSLVAGGFIDLEYVFDAGDRSPYLYLLGPVHMESVLGEEASFSENREWQIASDAAGKMILFLENSIPMPTGWTCVSCISTDTFFERLAVGSTTYGGLGGTATHTPTAIATVSGVTPAAGVGPNTTNNTRNAPLAHTHTLTPQISGVSNFPTYKDLRVIQSNSAGDPGTIPLGAIGIFDIASSSLPTGWLRYAPLDGLYTRGASSTATGGVNTHTHTATGTLAAPVQTGIREQNTVIGGSTDFAHTHTLSSTSTNSVNHEPPYVEVLFAKLSTASGTPNYLITMWDNTPPDGWTTVSNSGDAFDARFLKGSTTYGGVGGSASHAHATISAATTSVENNTNNYTASASNAQSAANHIHDVEISGFSDNNHRPPYVEVIFAKRLTGITVQTQDSYRVYANTNAVTPTDPWPAGGSDLSENSPVDSSLDALIPGNIMRLRMNVWMQNATSTIGADAYKLQYVASTDCPNALNWSDVGAMGSGSLWRGYNNTSVTNNITLPSLLLSSSTVLEAYSEENPSTVNPNQVAIGAVGEWDWVVNDNLAVGNTTYCFRMVKQDGTPLDAYSNYPSILTNAPPQQAVLSTPFDNEKVGTTTPEFQFYASDPETNDLDYQIQVAVSATFTSPTIDADSVSNPELFVNVPNPANKAPFSSGDTIEFIPSSALTNGSTYWWRVRAKDTNASNEWGAWSATSSITIDTSVTASTWFQTTRDQFALDSLNGVTTTADTMTLIVGSSTGIVYGPTIEFAQATAGTAWGTLSFTDTETSSDVKYQIEYYTSTSSWAVIPDSVLSGNAVGFDTTGVSLLNIDPETYPTLRIRANLTNAGASPIVSDWTLAWGYNVTTPTLTAPFDNQKVATRTPSFEWNTTDPQGDAITYQISWSTDPTFTSSTTRESNLHAGFLDLSWATDTNPFGSGDSIRYTVQTGDILASSTTYFWRVRGRDPSGANTYSFWSDTRSIYIDTTVTLSTWYQTADGQFNTGTLTSLYTTGTGSTTVSTTTDEIMLAYGEGAIQTPRYRIFDGLTLGNELSAESIGSTVQWLVLKASPVIGQYIMGTLGTDRDTTFQVYDNGVWGNVYESGTNAPSLARRSFDIAYETVSGRALAVSCNSSPDANYRIWDGSAWAATGTIDISSTSNCEWVRMASNPISNEIIALFRNTSSRYEAQVWNGTTSTWGNVTNLGSMTDIANEGMAVEYENSGLQALIVTSNGSNSSFVSKFWSATSSVWNGTTTVALGDDFEWGSLRRNTASDTMALCYVDEDGDIGAYRWDGNVWVGGINELETAPTLATKDRRPVDCMYDSMTGYKDNIMVVYSDLVATRYRVWNGTAWVAEQQLVNPLLPITWTGQLVRTAASGTMTWIGFDHVGTDYEYVEKTGSTTFINSQTIETSSSVTAAPYGQPFYGAAKNLTTQGTLISSAIDFDDGVAPAWKRALWNVTTPGVSTFKVQVEYQNASGTWALIPDTDLPDNSTGTSTSPITMTSLNTTTYNVVRLKGNFVCVLGNCPTLNDWTVEWAAGVRISGIARDHDLATPITSGTVAIAVGGSLQSGKTGLIDASGNWYIDNVTAFPGNILTVFVSGAADADEAVAIANYTGPGDAGGMLLAERWVTTGSASTTGQTLTLANLGLYDNGVSSNEDIFFDVDAGGDYNNCVVGACLDSSLYVYSNTLRFATATSETINTWDLRTLATMYGDTNTIKVSGSWRNLGTFIPNTGIVIFNGTSSTRTIDSTGAVSATFYNVTFGETGSTATWNFSSALTATGTTAMSFGTTSPGAYALTLQGNLTIGASGTFQKGTATTTFSGSVARTWTDSSASKQDLGNILIDGTTKTITLASSVRASDVTIGADDTLSLGGANTLFTVGSLVTNGTFTALTGTIDFAATTTGKIINQGTSNFYNTTFSGIGGTWLWQNTNATTTNDLLITGAGTTTLPSGTLAVGGSFNNTGGAFVHNSGVLRLTSTASGKTLRANGSSWNDLFFAGSGGAWNMADTNATSSGSFTITAGTPTLNSGTLAIGNIFNNQSGTFVANNGTLKMTSAVASRTITLGGSSLANLLVSGAGTFTITDTNATSTADIAFTAGTTVFPSGTFAIGGSLVNTGAVFTANGGLVRFNGSSGAKTINPGSSSFAIVSLNGAANFTMTNATTTGNFTLDTVGSFTQTSGTTLAVGGEFANRVSGAATTWTGSLLHLNSGTSYTLNTKVQGGDSYETLKLAASTFVRMWASSASTYQINAAASLYSQNHASTSGAVSIFGAYTRTSGSDYWSAAKDFDGVALATSSQRAATVRFESGASASFTDATLEIVGTSTATTTIDRITAGSYAVTLASSTINALHYKFNHMNSAGLSLAGSTTITSLDYGDFELDTNGGTLMTVASTTINHNNGIQIFNVRFALGAAVAGFNVTESDVAAASAYIRFKNHGGNLDGEANDIDLYGNPGNIRWDDSSFVIAISGTVYSDAGVTEMTAPTCDDATPVVKVKVSGGNVYSAPCASGGVGTYTIPGVTFSGETIMSIYLDTNGGPNAALITKSASGDLSGMNLYQDRVIVRHEDTLPMTIEDMNAFDSVDDADIPFTAATSGPHTLAVDPETEFWIWTGKTFVPNGNITLNSGGSGNNWDGTFHVDNSAVFTASSTEAHAVGGRFVVDSAGTFTAASSTFTFTATTSGKVITGVSAVTFWNTIFNGTGGNWSVNQTMNIGNNMTLSAGTLSGASSITVSGVSVTGVGSIALTGGTFTLLNGGSFGGTTDWSFYNLTFGNGTIATTTKIASSTITASGVLTIAGGHNLLAGTPSTWNLSGGGTPLVVSGALTVESALFRYSGTTATTITPGTYYRLYLAPSAAGGPTYTLGAGTFTIQNDLIFGDATNAGTTTINTNDPALSVLGDVIIRTGATLVGSNATAPTLYGSWENAGIFMHQNGTINFVATTTGHTIVAGNSSFGSVLFSSGTGGWTVSGNATTSGALSLTSVAQFTLSSGARLEVNGVFTNTVGGGATTWTDTTLYLNSASAYSLNASTTGADVYGTLQLGANTDVRMWDSSAATTSVAASGSLYSQDHSSVSGRLQIWGDYVRSTGTDYWSYATDFDGTVLGAPRLADVRITSGGAITISGSGALEVVGIATASTTIAVDASGTYAFALTGGSTTMQYSTLRNTDTNGLSLSGSPVINEISNGNFELGVNAGSMITVAGGTIDANPLKILSNNYFSTSSGITSGNNVRATGVSASIWRFSGAIPTPSLYGNYNGEAYDSDPGGDPGYIVWDDSAAQITISGNVYADEGETSLSSPTCNGVAQNVRLKVQGAGSYASACNSGDGSFSIPSVIFNPGDTLTLYLDTAGGAQAANISLDPATNINNMHLYRNFIILRHEQGSPMTIAVMDQYDRGQDADMPFETTIGGTNTLNTNAGMGLIIWNSKVFAPGGDVTTHANASSTSYDGTVKLYATSTWSAAASQVHRIGGHMLALAGASVAPSNSSFIFTATTSGKTIAASSSLTFYDLTMNGANGEWDIGGVGTTSNNITLTLGTTTLPQGELAVGGSFVTTGGVFLHNSGTVKFTAGTTGKTISAAGSSWNNLLFAGSGGGWSMTDTNATTTGSITVSLGTLALPNRVLAVGVDFNNLSGVVAASASSTLKMTAATAGRTIALGGSSIGGLHVAGNGIFTMTDANATTTGDIVLSAGTTTLPSNAFATYGSFTNQSVFTAIGTSTMSFTATTGGKTINSGNSSFGSLEINGAGQFTISSNATSTYDFTLRSAGAFTKSAATTLAVGRTFSNVVGGAQTTWANSVLSLYSGTSYAINTKTSGGDAYGAITLAPNTKISAWNSTSTLYALLGNASLYSQDHNAVDGDLYVFGTYERTLGTDYWSYATDFDGVALGGSSRQVDVRFASGTTAYFATGTTLQILGTAGASSTVDRQAAGNYGIEVQGAYLNAGYYQFRNTDRTGLHLTGTTTISAMNNGDFELGISNAAMLTVASTTIDQNASSLHSYLRFATSSGVANAINVHRIGTTSNAVTFSDETGNLASEAYDEDGDDACGSVRFTDSACLFADQKTYRWRNDDGGEGAPSSEWYDQNWSKRKRVRLANNTATLATSTQFKISVTYDADMQSDFDDLRFTDSSGTTTIPFWLESYSASATGTVWVKTSSLPASGVEDVFMYYGNGSAVGGGVGTSTFIFFDDFEDGSLSEYSGNTTLFEQSTSFNYERTTGLDASAGNEGTGKTTDGIGVVAAGVPRDSTIRFFQYIDMATGGSDEPCALFAIQSPITNHLNYGVCLSPFGADEITVVKNAVNNGRNDGATVLATKAVTYSTGWYEVSIDWLSSGNTINVNVYDATGAFFASTTASDATYTSGGIGYSYWSQHGGWDMSSARKYISATPTISFFTEQTDSGATWKAAENTTLIDQLANENVRLRLTLRNTGTTLTDQNLRLQVADKSAAPNCESVASGNYADVPTTSGSCGSSPACMKTSTQFSNQSSTTQLLSIPTGMTFTHGQMMEDPANETGDVTIYSGEFTEVEYNFQMTAFATQSSYCFRTTKAGVAVDNYTKVAELRMLHIPSLSGFSFNSDANIALVEGATTTIYATSTVTDYNGYADLAFASSTFYRSGLSSTTACTADSNDCYQIATSSCSFINCSGNTCTVSCSAPMYYFADPTDFGSIYDAQDWVALIDVWDTSSSHDTASSSQEVLTLQALTVPVLLDFGSVSVGADTGATNATTSVVNTGNIVFDLDIGGDPLVSGASSISYDREKYSTTTFTYTGCATCNVLTASTSPTFFPIAVTKPTSTSAFFKDIYWGIQVPLGTAATTHSGTNYFIAQ